MALNSLLCADVPLRNCSLTHSLLWPLCCCCCCRRRGTARRTIASVSRYRHVCYVVDTADARALLPVQCHWRPSECPIIPCTSCRPQQSQPPKQDNPTHQGTRTKSPNDVDGTRQYYNIFIFIHWKVAQKNIYVIVVTSQSTMGYTSVASVSHSRLWYN